MILTGLPAGGEPEEFEINTNIIMGLLMGTLFGAAAKAVAKGDKLKSARIKNLTTNVTLVGTMLMFHYFGNPRQVKPAAVIAGIPIGTAEELSHALSSRMLKYRATGGVFLAHQGGGNESLRVVCKAWGKNRYIFLTLVEFLFLYGSSKVIDLFAGALPITQNITTKGFVINKTKNPWTEIREGAIDEGKAEYHLTFPIVTRNRIYTSMFIETYDVIQSVEKGMNMLTITIFFRKWLPPLPFEFIHIKGGEQDGQNWYRKRDAIRGEGKYCKFIDAVLDYGLTIVMQLYRYQQAQEYTAYTPEQMIAITFATGLDEAYRDLPEGQRLSSNITQTSTQRNMMEILFGIF